MRTHARARRLILRVAENGQVRLTVPPRTPKSQIDAFLAKNGDWLHRNVIAAQEQHSKLCAAEPPEYLELAAVGERWRLERVERVGLASARATLRPSTSPDLFTLRVIFDPKRDEVALKVKTCVRRALVERAKVYYRSQLIPLAAEMGVEFKRLQVRSQRSVWGSCSSTGTISLNLAGLFLKPELARYLCIHELAHLRHMNHSGAFWRLVQSIEPTARSLDAELGGTHAVLPRWLW
ncbi:MAG: SprT family zinc-dependent metalloprotease [Pseudomonadota bacterium]